MSTKPGEVTGAKPAGKGLRAWIKTHQKQALFGAAATGVVGLALLKKKSSAASSSSSQAIDPATGVPYATELGQAQQSASVGDAGYYGSGTGGYAGDGGGGYGDPLGTDITQLEAQITALQSQIGSNGGTGTNSLPPNVTPVVGVNPGGIDQGVTPVGGSISSAPAATPSPIQLIAPPTPATPTISPIGTDLSPAAASAAVASGSATAAQALAAEVPASAETSAERHAQEVANRGLRAQLKS